MPTPLRTYSLTHHGCTYQVPLGAEARRGLERALLGAAARPTGSGAGNAAGTHAPPEPEAREYVLRCRAARPQLGATPTAQRVYVGLRGGQWRLALALSLDQDFGDGAFD